jgi:outer membrane protein assembly factor BamB
LRKNALRPIPSLLLVLGAALVGTLGGDPAAVAESWSRFRGPNGGGVAHDASNLPTTVGATTHLAWRTPLPPGHSSPVIAAQRIFLTAAEGDDLLTICLELAHGRELWRRVAPRDRHQVIDNRNGPAAPTPVTDGERVIAFFGDFGLIAYDLDGRELWRHPLGPFNNLYGIGASPILAGDLVILPIDQHHGSFLLALDKSTGALRWRTERAEASSGHSTPVLHQPEGGELQIVLPGSFFLTGYTASSGERLWWVSGLSFEMKSTPAVENGVLFINGYGSPFNEPGQEVRLTPFDQVLAERDANRDQRIEAAEAPNDLVREWLDFVDLDRDGSLNRVDWEYFQRALASRNGLLAVRLPGADERNDLTGTHILWTYHEKVPQLPSPVAANGVLLMVNDRGIATTLRTSTGEVIAQDRLEGAIDSYYASPIAADGRFYVLSRTGKLVVLASDGRLEPLAVSDLDDLANATPAAVADRLLVRTDSALWAFAGPEQLP